MLLKKLIFAFSIVFCGFLLYKSELRDFKNFYKLMFTPISGDEFDGYVLPIFMVKREKKIKTFPPYFMIGTASSAYQIEGGWNEDGKTPSIWDDFVHYRTNVIADNSTGDVGPDSYHHLDDDVKALKLVGVSRHNAIMFTSYIQLMNVIIFYFPLYKV